MQVEAASKAKAKGKKVPVCDRKDWVMRRALVKSVKHVGDGTCIATMAVENGPSNLQFQSKKSCGTRINSVWNIPFSKQKSGKFCQNYATPALSLKACTAVGQPAEYKKLCAQADPAWFKTAAPTAPCDATSKKTYQALVVDQTRYANNDCENTYAWDDAHTAYKARGIVTCQARPKDVQTINVGAGDKWCGAGAVSKAPCTGPGQPASVAACKYAPGAWFAADKCATTKTRQGLLLSRRGYADKSCDLNLALSDGTVVTYRQNP